MGVVMRLYGSVILRATTIRILGRLLGIASGLQLKLPEQDNTYPSPSLLAKSRIQYASSPKRKPRRLRMLQSRSQEHAHVLALVLIAVPWLRENCREYQAQLSPWLWRKLLLEHTLFGFLNLQGSYFRTITDGRSTLKKSRIISKQEPVPAKLSE